MTFLTVTTASIPTYIPPPSHRSQTLWSMTLSDSRTVALSLTNKPAPPYIQDAILPPVMRRPEAVSDWPSTTSRTGRVPPPLSSHKEEEEEEEDVPPSEEEDATSAAQRSVPSSTPLHSI